MQILVQHIFLGSLEPTCTLNGTKKMYQKHSPSDQELTIWWNFKFVFEVYTKIKTLLIHLICGFSVCLCFRRVFFLYVLMGGVSRTSYLASSPDWLKPGISPYPAGSTHLSDLSYLSAIYFHNKTLLSLVIASPLLPLVWTLSWSITKATFNTHYIAVFITILLTHIINNLKKTSSCIRSYQYYIQNHLVILSILCNCIFRRKYILHLNEDAVRLGSLNAKIAPPLLFLCYC